MTVAVADDYVYLDWAATAPLCEEAAAAMAPYLAPGAANVALGMNANSLHAPGRAAFEAMELARRSFS
ncbi:MAG: cysteine desulfurase, partial [Eggerthellaceae bacterium]|nr:cysteine desulfurase [Eggerthellaceae bacterium]